MPEYGRLVQQMVKHAIGMDDRSSRQAYAEKIIRIMAHLNPKMRGVPDYEHKLWDHLAYISNYELDIDYPVEVSRHDERERPAHLCYPQNRIRYRHYGHLLERAIEKAADMPEGEAREHFVVTLAKRMKRNLAEWKGDGVTDEKVAYDLSNYTEGRISI